MHHHIAKHIPLLIAGILANTAANAEIPQGERPTLTLETVISIEWEEFEGAHKYKLMVDGKEVFYGLGTSTMILHEGPLDEIKIKAHTRSDEALGETTLLSTEKIERLVLRWDEAHYNRPFLGVRTVWPDGGTGSSIHAVDNSPCIVRGDPAIIVKILIGERLSEPAEGTLIPIPFDFDGDEVIEYGPFLELELP